MRDYKAEFSEFETENEKHKKKLLASSWFWMRWMCRMGMHDWMLAHSFVRNAAGERCTMTICLRCREYHLEVVEPIGEIISKLKREAVKQEFADIKKERP